MVSAAQIEVDGTLAIAAIAVEEMLSRRKAEEATLGLELQLDLREKFLSLMSHDLRNPLTAARANAELIGSQLGQSDFSRKLAAGIVRALDYANQMISDLLDVNRLRSGAALPIKRAPCDLRAVVKQTLDDLASTHRDRCLLGDSDEIPCFIDAAHVRRALENLISNAVKYGSPATPISVRLSGGPEQVKLTVHNFGNPISRGEQAALFQWHGRTRSAQESGEVGWGLGLMLVKGIAEAHGGSVEVASSAEAGTAFTITIPRG